MNSKISGLPAVVIGGPPHSGKSVLAYSLSRVLRLREVPHYVLRAYPDGEGDWANEADNSLVRALRVKGIGTPEWIQRITRDIAARPLPLLIDPGGKPLPWQEAVFRECTHGILLCPDDAARHEWRARFIKYDLLLLADLKSELTGLNTLESAQGVLRGTLAGLERGHRAAGPAFEQLVEWLARLFAYSSAGLHALNVQRAPTELVIELDRLAAQLAACDENKRWRPAALPRVLHYLPQTQPLAVYGRGPNWLYAALALHTFPQPFYQFDSRLGWVTPPRTQKRALPSSAPVQFVLRESARATTLRCTLVDSYLEYAEIDFLRVPEVSASRGMILDGKLPLWLWTALARAYAQAKWLAVYQPQLAHAFVVHSRDATVRVGDLIPYRSASSALDADR